MTAAVFLDRDNTLIPNDGDLGDPAQVRLIQGAASAIASLKGLGYKIIVVSNQGGVARGKYGEADVDRVHERINELVKANSGVAIDRFYYCPYHPEGTVERYRRDHPWRKPRPGMLLQAARDLGLDLKQSWMIGDQMRDVQAGFTAGVIPILLTTDGVAPAPLATPAPAVEGVSPGAMPGGGAAPGGERAPAAKTVLIEAARDYFVVRSLIEAVRLVGQKSRPTNVTAAMKTERMEVVPKPQPRVATASFDADVIIAPGASERDADEPPAPPKPQAKHAAKAERDADGDSVTVAVKEPPGAAHGATGDAASSRKRAKAEKPRLPEHDETPMQPAAAVEVAAPHRLPSAEMKPARVPPSKRRDAETHVEPSPSAAPVGVPGIEAPASRPSPRETPPSPQAEAPSPALPAPKAAPTALSSAPAAPSASPAPAPSPAPDPSASANAPLSAEQSLRQILQELRSQRKVTAEFSYAAIMAIVLQMVAVVCMMAALLMGAGNNDIFMRWTACAIVLQLATIAVLMLRR